MRSLDAQDATIGAAGRLVLAVATALFVGVALHAAWTDGPTFDEGTYIASGVSALTRHDLRVNRQHPPLGKVLAAAPVLLLHPTVPGGVVWARARRHGADYVFAGTLMRDAARAGHLRRDVFAARVAPVLEAAATAWAIAALATALFGGGAGVLAGLLWLANPLVLGLGHLDGIDIPATLAVTLAAWATLVARRRQSTQTVVVAGLACGAAILTRVTGAIVVPVAALAVASAGWRTGPRRAFARATTIVAVAWATVVVVYVALAPGEAATARTGVAGAVASAGHVLVPPAWREGTTFLARVGAVPGPAYLLGRAHVGRWLFFWPASLAVKLPPTTLLVLALAPLAWFGLPRRVLRDAAFVVAAPALLHAAFTLTQQRPLGLRYLLPTIALWTVAASAIVTRLGPARRRAVTGVAVVGAVAATVLAPSLAWTDPLFGPGYRVATDSNFDWGQSFYALQTWSAQHRPWLEYFGDSVVPFPHARALRHAPPRITGWVAVSASDLTTWDRTRLSWLRAYCPVGVLDHTVLLYRFDRPPDRARHGPAEPPRECPGSVSQRVVS